jgi:hypothetical protein
MAVAWTVDQQDVLCARWGIDWVREIGDSLGRSKSSCIGRAHRLGLPKLPSRNAGQRRNDAGERPVSPPRKQPVAKKEPVAMTKRKDADAVEESMDDAIERAAPEWPSFPNCAPEDREFYAEMRWAPGLPSDWPWRRIDAPE